MSCNLRKDASLLFDALTTSGLTAIVFIKSDASTIVKVTAATFNGTDVTVDAAGKITLPARFIPDPAIRTRNGAEKTIVPFKVCGATCDSVDILSRPFWLPETVDTGDWIEIGHIGAYSLSLRTRFNGFFPDTFVELTTPFDEGDAPQGFASLETMAH